MSTTAQTVINGAARLIGVMAEGETLTAGQSNDALLALNEMIDSWSTESLLIFAEVIETFALVGGQQLYTWGATGNWNSARPQDISRANIQVLGTPMLNEIPLEIINQDAWSGIQVKGVSSSIPTKLYNDGQIPLTNVYLWPIPSVANNIIFYSWKPLAQFANLATSFVFPPGYLKAMRYNLAVTLAPEYGKMPSELVLAGAAESKSSIKRMNIVEVLMSTDAAIAAHSKSFNWITGE